MSPTCPGPRSAHAVVSSPVGGGKLFLFGVYHGPVSILRAQTNSYQVANFHRFTKIPSITIATSGALTSPRTLGIESKLRSDQVLDRGIGVYTYQHRSSLELTQWSRMAMWKHYIVLFGGFYDPGITTRYLNDLWVFDTQEYKWQQIEFRQTDTKPSWVVYVAVMAFRLTV